MLGIGESYVKSLIKARVVLVIRPDYFEGMVRKIFAKALDVDRLGLENIDFGY